MGRYSLRMDFYRILSLPSLITISLLAWPLPASALETVIVAEGHYVMGDSDTLAAAEERVLQRAQRNAVEQAGLYIESTFLDREKTEAGTSLQVSSLEIRTIAGAITKTEILESRRTFINDRPNLYVRIRAIVDLDSLKTAVRKWHSEQRLVEHYRRLQKENASLKTQLETLRTSPSGVRTLMIEPVSHNIRTQAQARTLLEKAMTLQDLPLKLELASQAVVLAPQFIDPLILRGQIYLSLASVAHSNQTMPTEYSEYIDNARMDFDRALLIDPHNTWALLGKGDVDTWLNRHQEAVLSFERVLELAPFFDLARLRLISLYTAEARKLVALEQWVPALSVLHKCLPPHLHESWIPYQKESYFIRSTIYQQLKQASLAIEDLSTILRVDPSNTRALRARAQLYQDTLQGDSAKNNLAQACMPGSMLACNQLP
jgi:tetratricopeptide (TPR) repeat protein